jgi:tRNA G18 (ribose-2'-O)-methylase SpoU
MSANADLQLTLSLRSNRRQRRRQGRFLVEGVRPIDHALAHGWAVESAWYRGGHRLSGWAESVLDQVVDRYELAPELMAELSGKEETSELVLVLEIPPDDLGRIRPHEDPLVVAFDRPVSPGNLGSVIRSADALGADGVIVTGHAADVYDPQTVRASMGSLFAVPVVRVGRPGEAAGWAKRLGLQVVGSSTGAATRVWERDLTAPTLLAVGNETRGLSAAWQELCDELVAVPMAGSADSLNAAAAASVLLYEAARQRSGGRGP